MSDRYEYRLLVKLGYQLWQAVELRIGKEADEVRPVARRDVVSLEVEGDISERRGVAVDIEGLDGGAEILDSVLFGGLDLAEEILGEVARCCDATLAVTKHAGVNARRTIR